MRKILAYILSVLLAVQASAIEYRRTSIHAGPLANIESFRSYVRAQKPTLFLDPDYVGSDRENLYINSEVMGSLLSLTRATVTSNSTTAPDGASTADTLVDDSTGGSVSHAGSFSAPLGGVISGNTYRVSIYAKRKGTDARSISLRSNFGGTGFALSYAHFDIINCATNGTTGASIIQTAESVGDGWCRLSVTQVADATSTGQNFAVMLYDTGTASAFYAGDGTSGAYIWGAQIQRVSANSVYTPTTTAAIASAQPLTSSVGVVSTIGTLYGSTAAFTQSTDANKPVLSRPDRVENLITQSAAPSNAVWDKTADPVTLSENSDSDYLGTANSAHSILAAATSDRHHAINISPSSDLVAGGIYRACVDFKYSNYQYGSLGEGNDSAWHSVIVDLSAGTIADSDNATATIEALGNSWQRVCITFTRTNSSAHWLYIGFSGAATSASGAPPAFLGTGAEKILFNRPTLQRSSMQPTYIATTTVPVYGSLTGRRMLTLDGSNDTMASTSLYSDIFGASAKTIFAVGHSSGYTATQNILSDNAGSNGRLVYHHGSGYIGLRNNDGSTVANAPLAPPSANTPIALMSWHDGTNLFSAYNRLAAVSVASGATAAMSGSLKLGSTGASEFWNGQLGPIITFNRVLPQPVRDTIRAGLQKFWRVG